MKRVLIAVMAGACATGSTYRSGVGDKMLERAPYYAGDATPLADTTHIGRLPTGYQRGATQPPLFEPSSAAGTPLAALLEDIEAYLDSLNVGVKLRPEIPGTPPDVRFSCETKPGGPDDECATGDGALGRDDIVMHLAVGRPSANWVAGAAAMMDSAHVSTLLVVTLEIGQYRVRQRGILGSKEVELGTNHVVSIPWLTSLETPVAVLQLTGARIGRDGRAQRIGAEGLLPKRTSLPISAIGGQALITDAEIAQLRNAPGEWQIALRNLMRGLTNR